MNRNVFFKAVCAAFIMTLLFAVSAYAYIDGGYCDNNIPMDGSLTWTCDTVTGVLKISGSGTMADFTYDTMPWNALKGSIETVIVEDGVKNIGNYAFAYCRNVIDVSLPNSLVKIGDHAFDNIDALKEITVPEGVKELGEYSFSYCEQLIKVTLPESLEKIDDCAFREDSILAYIDLPDGVTYIGVSAFSTCLAFDTDRLPKSLKTIGESAFAYCKGFTGTVEMPQGLESIGVAAFYRTGINKVILNKNLKTVDVAAFYECRGLTELYVSAGTGEIYMDAFAETGLKKITFEEGCDVKIDSCAFESSLVREIYIPSTLTKIENDAFADSRLETVIFADGSLSEKFDFEGVTLLTHVCARDGKIHDYLEKNCADRYTLYTEETSVVREPGCTESGLERTYCKYCGRVVSEKETVEALGHEWSTECVETEPECLIEGTRTYKCTREGCGETKIEYIDALGHDYVKDEKASIEPDCKNGGMYVMACSRCSSKEYIPVPKTDVHDFDAGVITIEPTFENEGEMTYTCKVCGFTKTEPIDKLAPLPEPTPTPEPTITPGPTYTPVPTFTPAPTAAPEMPLIDSVAMKYDEAVIYLHKNDNPEQALTLKITPENADIASIEWDIDREGIVKLTVNDDKMGAKLCAAKIGRATVSVTVTDKNGHKYTAKTEFTVNKNAKKIKSIKFTDKKLVMNKGEKIKPEFTYKPATAYNDTFKYKSSNKKVAKVSKDGTVTAVKKGSAVITVTSANGKKATIKIKVK